MNTAELLDRLLAWDLGHPLPTTETLPFPRVPDAERLVLAFVRMAGESSPWGIALGRPDESPQCFTVPEPRNADLHAAFVESFAPRLLAHVGHPLQVPEDPRGLGPQERPPPADLVRPRQLWLPGPTHLEMLHFLDFRYTLAATGEVERLRTLRAFGRACGWLFRESTRPGQVRVHDATARLREVLSFPSEPLRQQHLGFLLAWLGDGDRDQRQRVAADAEHAPVGVTMLPAYERDTLQALVERFNNGDTGPQRDAARDAIHAALAVELTRRWHLTVRALRALELDPRPDNPQLGPVLDLAVEEFQYQYWRHEQLGLRADLSAEERRNLGSHPETDFSPPRAARRYFLHLHAHELAAAELVHGDSVLLERALDAGDGFAGTVSGVARETVQGRSRVRWTVETSADDTLRLREESKVCLVGARKRAGAIVEVSTDGPRRRIVVELTEGLTKKALPELPNADEAGWVGRTVRFLDRGVVGISLRKGYNVGSAEGPGAWLTHAAPLPEPSPSGLVRPDLVDLVRTLEK